MSFIVLLFQILTQVLRYVPHCFVMPDPDPGVEVFPSFLFFYLCHRYMEACQILTQVLNCVPDQEDVWLMVADIYAGCQDYHSAAQVKFHLTSSFC